MAITIRGLPPGFQASAGTPLNYVVTRLQDGSLSLVEGDAGDKFVAAINSLIAATLSGETLYDFKNVDIDGSIKTFRLSDDPTGKLLYADYRNADSAANISIQPIVDGDVPTSSAVTLEPDATVSFVQHLGFKSWTPTSAAAILQVTIRE